METNENLLLTSTNFSESVQTNWQKLQNEKSLCDVTLACEDKLISTHKLIICSSSSVLRNIVMYCSTPNPIIFLKGVSYKNLENIITFMYQGEVGVDKDQIDSFLDVAQDLKIQGLYEEQDKSFNKINDMSRVIIEGESSPKRKQVLNKEFVEGYGTTLTDKLPTKIADESMNFHNIAQKLKIQELYEEQDKSFKDRDDLFEFIVKSESSPKQKMDVNTEFVEGYGTTLTNELPTKIDDERKDFQDESQTSKSLLSKILLGMLNQSSKKQVSKSLLEMVNQVDSFKKEELNETPKIKEKLFSCRKCGDKFPEKINLYDHTKSVHGEVRYPCNRCDHQGTSKRHLKLHIESVHDGVKYPCGKCDFKVTQKKRLNEHVKTMHEGFRYSCDKCDFKGIHKESLNVHIESIHNGIYYPCNICGFRGVTRQRLRKHTESVHEGIVYPCDQCDWKGRSSGSLKEHTEAIHKGIQYPCTHCPYKSSSKFTLQKHYQIRHN